METNGPVASMDPLRGYVGFGFYVLILALYWLIQTAYILDRNISRKDGKLRRWRFSCKSDNSRCTAGSSGSPASTVDSGLPVDRTPSCPASFWCVRAQRWPLEAAFRFLLSLVAASSELCISALKGTFSYHDTQDAQRATVYGLICVSGLIDLLCHFRLLYPTGSGHFVISLAFAAQAFFFFQTSQIESVASSCAIACVAAATIVEIWWDRTPTSRLPRIFFSLLASTWLLHVGFRQLLTERGDPLEDTLVTTTTPPNGYAGWTALLFIWHAGAAVIVMLCFAAVTKCAKMLYNRCNLSQNSFFSSSCCPCSSTEDEGFRASPTDDLEETQPLALHP